MKGIIFLVFIVTACVVKPHSQNPENITAFIFKTGTRGYQKEITITKDSVYIHVKSNFRKEDNIDEGSKTTEKEWSSLLSAVKDLKLSEIPTLKSPTMARSYDAAYESGMTITTSGNKRWMHVFDNYNPNEKLKNLMQAIQEIEKSRLQAHN